MASVYWEIEPYTKFNMRNECKKLGFLGSGQFDRDLSHPHEVGIHFANPESGLIQIINGRPEDIQSNFGRRFVIRSLYEALKPTNVKDSMNREVEYHIF